VDQSGYRKLFKEISKGYSPCFLGKDVFYIKHQSLDGLVDFDDVYNLYLGKALSRGLESKQDILDSLDKEGIWTSKDESDIQSQSFYLENLQKNKKNIVLKSALTQINLQVEEAEKKLKELEAKKSGLISSSAEQYALNRANDFYIYNSFYKDKDLNNRLYSEEEFDYINNKEVTDMIILYNTFHEKFKDENIQSLAIQDFYKVYYHFSETCRDFFGKPAVDLTNFQMNLILYTRVFKNIFDQHDDIPERIKKDPAALLDFANSSEARDDIKKKFNDDRAGGSTIVGATEEDLKELGLNQSEGKKSLSQAAKEKGGTLSMKDLMDLSGA
jgi:hypothetical protein